MLTQATQTLASLKQNALAITAKDYSRFLIASDGAGWVLDEEGKEILKIAKTLGIRGAMVPRPLPQLKQCVHYTSHFSLANPAVFETRHRISVDYFHGKPEQGADFAVIYDAIKKNHRQIRKIRVSYSEMEKLVKTTGIDPQKVIRIPIGINPTPFVFQTSATKRRARQDLSLPDSAVVIGSFQKDGSGWGDGMEPKHVKGPDVFLKAIGLLHKEIPELFVLLTGPARGFVKKGLEVLGVPYKHFYLKNYSEIGRYYQALDAYMVASREEGGPKAILESMISGVPIISTRAGQAIDLIAQEENGYLVDVEDHEALAKFTLKYLSAEKSAKETMLMNGHKTAMGQTYEAQLSQWRRFFDGLVDV